MTNFGGYLAIYPNGTKAWRCDLWDKEDRPNRFDGPWYIKANQ